MSFVASAVVGHSNILNLSAIGNVKKYGETFPSSVKRALRSVLNIAHWIKKWYSVSIAGSAAGGKHGQGVPGQVGHGGAGPGRQY